ncbi:acyltransferase family protein [Modestobacter sp. SYSU DS0511]
MTAATTIDPSARAGHHIPSLDGLRAIAVMVVFIGHGHVVPERWPGHVGVTVFFFLSGFLITTLLRREQDQAGSVSLKKFYLRRALRILPPAYLCIATSLVLSSGIKASGVSFWGVAAELLNYTNYYIVFAGRDGLPPETSNLWSLGVEEHYYLLFPVLLLLALRSRLSYRSIGWGLLGLAVAVMIWRLHLFLNGADFYRLYVATDTRVDSLLYGSAMALLWNPTVGDRPPWPRVFDRWIPRVVAPVAVAAFVASALSPSLFFRLTLADVVQCFCLIPIFWTLITRPMGLAGRALNKGWVAHLGVLSFSTYLFHRMVLAVVGDIIDVPIAADVVSLAVTLVGAEVVYLVVEKPCAKLRRRLEAGASSPAS